jgi:amino acid transporter
VLTFGRVKLREVLFGRPLRSDEDDVERVGVLTAIPVLGLDALASASYGPEAALTVLLPLGVAATARVMPLMACIVAVLVVVGFSYSQTIPAYPNGGGSFTVAKENLGRVPGLLAAAALCTDYVLNVAVAISAGVGAITSAVPGLLPHTLLLCLLILLLLVVVNLRGVRDSGLVFLLPTYLFLACLLGTIGVGAAKAVLAHGHPAPLVRPPAVQSTLASVTPWLMLHAFASGCTALTGVEAVSNAVPIFRKPKVVLARRTLACIIISLALLVAGVGVLSHAYGITATPPGQAGYQSVLSQMVGAVAGRGGFYYVSMAAVFAVLALSANTSFTDFPRVCRLLALDEYLPPGFAHRGRRLVYSSGIVVLGILAAALLVVFGGITDRLVPLFAVGAFMAFTASQAGMVAHWKREGGRHARKSLVINLVGALATAATLCIIIVSKFREGAWLTLIVIPALLVLFLRVRAGYERVARQREDPNPLELDDLCLPIVVVPLQRLDRVSRKALRFAMTLSRDVRAVQVLTEEMKLDDLTSCWPELVERPARVAGFDPPQLVVLASEYREFYGPFLEYLRKLSGSEGARPIAVLVPELVRRRWYHFFVQSRATLLKALLLLEGGPQISVINTPWYLENDLDGVLSQRGGRRARLADARLRPRSTGQPASHAE